ncbi:MAG: EAL domain-containing protein [Campylobacterales bacterium]
MRTIYTQVSKQFTRSLTIQILFSALVLSIALFVLTAYQSYRQQQQQTLDLAALYHQSAAEESRLIHEKISAIGSAALMLATQGGELLSRPGSYENGELTLVKEGAFYRNDRLGRFTFYAEVDSMGPEARRRAQRFALLLPLLETAVTARQKDAVKGWLHLEDTLSLVYPPQSNLQAVGDAHNLGASGLFELFRKNPRKQWRFVIQKDSIVIAAPVFSDENLVGIAGFTLNRNLFDLSDTQTRLPEGSFAALFNAADETLLSGSLGDRAIKTLLQEKSGGALVAATSVVADTPLTVAIGGDRAVLLRESRALFLNLLIASGAVVVFVAGFYLLFFRIARQRVQALSESFTKPLNEIVRFSHHLGMRSAGRLEPSGITELDDLSNHLHLAHSKLMQMLIVDELTGTYNRRKLLIDLEGRGPFGLIAMNINRFKYLNDIYGYAAGDYVLKRTVELLKDIECEGCEIYRIGGDEFAVLLPTMDIDLLKAHAENMVASVGNSLFLFNDVEMEVSVSVGVASGEGREGVKLLSRADIALSKAREVKQMPVMVYTPDLEARKDYEANLYWEKRIKDAIRMGTMVPWFQPIMEIKSGKILKFEALVRIVEKGDAIPPYYFLEAARKTGAMYEIARRMINQTFETAAKHEGVEFSINLSLSDFEHPELLPYISDQLKKAGLEAGKITFEVLETEAMHQEDSQVQNAIKALKDKGFKVAIDDFGSGYSNFARFVDLKVDYLKIDGQFIRNLHRDETSRHALKAILEFASGTGAKTVAEYVETRRVHEAVKLFPIDYAQGFYISKPVPAEELPALIRR